MAVWAEGNLLTELPGRPTVLFSTLPAFFFFLAARFTSRYFIFLFGHMAHGISVP